MYHYTNKKGFNSIRSSPTWRFIATKPPGEHPVGAYFTNLPCDTPRLATRLRIPRDKISFLFEVEDDETLISIPGGRGKYIFYSTDDYLVEKPQQVGHGPVAA